MGRDVVERIDADLAELVDRFLECSRRDQEALERALDADDLDTARRIGHSAKGAGAAYGWACATSAGNWKPQPDAARPRLPGNWRGGCGNIWMPSGWNTPEHGGGTEYEMKAGPCGPAFSICRKSCRSSGPGSRG